VRFAGTHIRGAAGACGNGIAQREADVAIIFAAGRRRNETKYGSGSYSAGLFSIHSTAKLGAPESRTYVSKARRLSPGCLWNPHAISIRLFRKNAYGGFKRRNYDLSARAARRSILRSAPAP